MRIVVILGLLAGFALSPRLWLTSRTYPLTPVVPALVLQSPADRIVFVTLLALLLALLVTPRRMIFAAVFAIFALLGLQDQSRWQPWFYQYALMLLAMVLAGPSREDIARQTCRLILAATYIWSGLAKLNPAFFGDTFPWLVAPLIKSWPAGLQGFVNHLAFAVPIVEFLAGVGLLIPRFRRPAVGLVIAMHVFILLALGPLGLNFNPVVWPWNLAMMALVILLFGRREKDASVRDIVWGRGFTFQRIALALVALAPPLAFFGLWDDYLSCALYSGNTNYAEMDFNSVVLAKLPAGIRPYVTHDADVYTLNFEVWSFEELHVPPYPEVRIFRNVARTICRDTSDDFTVKLHVEGKIVPRQPNWGSRLHLRRTAPKALIH